MNDQNDYEEPRGPQIPEIKLPRLDGSKFGQVALAPFCDLAGAHRVITDDSVPQATISHMRQLGIDMVVV